MTQTSHHNPVRLSTWIIRVGGHDGECTHDRRDRDPVLSCQHHAGSTPASGSTPTPSSGRRFSRNRHAGADDDEDCERARRGHRESLKQPQCEPAATAGPGRRQGSSPSGTAGTLPTAEQGQLISPRIVEWPATLRASQADLGGCFRSSVSAPRRTRLQSG